MTKNGNFEQVGRAVAVRRGELGMTQQDLADAANVDVKTVGNLESRGSRPIARNRAAISAALGWEGDGLMALASGAGPVEAEPAGEPAPVAALPAAGYDAPPVKPSHAGTPPLIAALLAKPGMDDYLAEIDAERADGGFVARDKYEVAIWTDPVLTEQDKRAIIAYGRLLLAEGVQMGGQTDSTVGLSQYTAL